LDQKDYNVLERSLEENRSSTRELGVQSQCKLVLQLMPC